MKKWAFLAVASIGLGCLYLFFRLGDEEPVQPLTNPSALSQESAPESERISGQSSEGEPPPQEAEGISGWVLSVDGGAPVPDASVVVSRRDDDAREEAKTTTDSEGAFNVAGIGAGDYIVEATHADLVSEKPRYAVNVPGDEALAVVEIWMTRGGVVSGRMYDAVTQAGIPGLEVGIGRKRTPGAITDEDGRYRIGGITQGNKRVYYAKAKGYLFPPTHTIGLKVSVTLGQELDHVDVAFQPGVFAAIEGMVIDEAGEPVADVEVTAARQFDSLMGRSATKDITEPDGSFRLDDLEVADGYFLDARIEGHLSGETSALALTAEGIADVVLTLRPTSSISGSVVDLAGDPIGDSTLKVKSIAQFRGSNAVGRHPTELGENGEFLMANLSAGSYGLFVESESGGSFGIVRPQIMVELESGDHVEGITLEYNYARYVENKKLRETRRAARTNRTAVEKPAQTELNGQVLQASTGEPVRDFTLRTRYSEYDLFAFQVIHDDEGRFGATKKEGLDLSLIVTAKGYSPGRIVVGDSDAQRPVIVRLRKGALVEGEVVNAAGRPVAGASIYIAFDPSLMDPAYPIPGMRMADAVSLDDGSFTLDTLTDAPERLFASAPAYAMGTARIFPSRSGVTKAKIVLSKGGRVEGTVRQSGQGVSGRTIMVRNEAGKTLQLNWTQTDLQGHYRYEHFVPGRYTLYTSLGDPMTDRWTQFREAEIEEDKVTVVDFDFSGVLGTLEGIVRVDGVPLVSNIQMEIVTEFAQDKFGVRSGASGEYVIRNLPAGIAEVSVSAVDGEGIRHIETFSLEIEAGSTLRHDFDLVSDQ